VLPTLDIEDADARLTIRSTRHWLLFGLTAIYGLYAVSIGFRGQLTGSSLWWAVIGAGLALTGLLASAPSTTTADTMRGTILVERHYAPFLTRRRLIGMGDWAWVEARENWWSFSQLFTWYHVVTGEFDGQKRVLSGRIRKHQAQDIVHRLIRTRRQWLDGTRTAV